MIAIEEAYKLISVACRDLPCVRLCKDFGKFYGFFCLRLEVVAITALE